MGDLGLPWRDLIGIYRNLSSYVRSPFFATHQSQVWARGDFQTLQRNPPRPPLEKGGDFELKLLTLGCHR